MYVVNHGVFCVYTCVRVCMHACVRACMRSCVCAHKRCCQALAGALVHEWGMLWLMMGVPTYMLVMDKSVSLSRAMSFYVFNNITASFLQPSTTSHYVP